MIVEPLLRLSRSIVGEREIQEVTSIIKNGFLGMGPETQLFEQELEQYLGGGRPVCCVNTGTSALQLSVQSCGIGPGSKNGRFSLTGDTSNPAFAPGYYRAGC